MINNIKFFMEWVRYCNGQTLWWVNKYDPEGKTVKVPYDLVENTIDDLLGCIRSTYYVNAYTLKDLPKCTTFLVLIIKNRTDKKIIIIIMFLI